ncbi:hypothetical protein CKO29_15180 [Allochromatium vinosum]|nr:hypothetical protein [Allochromatium vinosum]
MEVLAGQSFAELRVWRRMDVWSVVLRVPMIEKDIMRSEQQLGKSITIRMQAGYFGNSQFFRQDA